LQVWRDLNEDGLSEASELFSLADYQISSISLSVTPSGVYREGHLISHTGSYQKADGSVGTVEDVWFEVDSRLGSRILDQEFEFVPEARLHPVLYGYGRIPST
jgi:hypothetical protein